MINEIIIPPKQKKTYKKRLQDHELNYENYFKYTLTLGGYKVNELKKACSTYKVKVTGTKPVLIERLTEQFNKIYNSIHIQRIYRGHYLRFNLKNRGNALHNRALCNNQTDFCTMEPIEEIEPFFFFSYTDDNNFTYGFNITSLAQVIRRKGKVINPYNRSLLPHSTTKLILSIYYGSFILNTGFREENINDLPSIRTYIYPNLRRSRNRTRNRNRHRENYNPEQHQQLVLMNTNRGMTFDNRVQALCMEIERLQTAVNADWMLQLSLTSYRRLYIFLYDIWYYRANIPYDIKYKICYLCMPRGTPFVRNYRSIQLYGMDEMELKTIVLQIMENLVYCGIDEEYRKIGSFHALSALTVVSSGARSAFPWLYDAIIY